MQELVTQWWFTLPILAVFFGILALAPLGAHVLKRGVVFIDLAVAQSAAAAALWGSAYIHHATLLEIQLMAILGGLIGAFIVSLIARYRPAHREALIGLVYVVGSCLALLGSRQDALGRERMSELLAADVLWANGWQVGSLSLCAIVMSLIWHWRYQWLSRDVIFYVAFSVVTSMAVSVLGLFVVFAALIAPAVWFKTGVSWLASLAGTLAAASAGLFLSWMFDAPSGILVGLAMSTWGLLSVFKQRWIVFRDQEVSL